MEERDKGFFDESPCPIFGSGSNFDPGDGSFGPLDGP